MHPAIAPLPDHLAERARTLGVGQLHAGASVVYWMRTAARAHDNPALDAALSLAEALDRPFFVYHALSQRYPYASDRHHRFILEGARDVQAELGSAGIAYAFHLERAGADAPFLKHLAERAAVVVTEDMPTPPMRRWAQVVAEAGPAPVLLVDTACTLPMRLVKRRPERAFRFRKETERARAERLHLPWPPFAGRIVTALPDDLPFAPVDLARADLGALVASCDIDHTVGPVADTPGGSGAGYARWADFRDNRLHQYGRRRNDALDREGVSRMSAHLHMGHVSPFVLARDAMAVGGSGAEKFLDELLVWRELAYAWCFHVPDIETITALPRWARETLDAHRNDLRSEVFDAETLARGRTDDALWDAAQRSLLIHGELHNNLRMTWGKALARWSATPEQALARLVDLNHRYALDGRDPNSYGGLFWCLGLFDRPFEPEKPIMGKIRPRTTDSHAQRLDVEAYAARTGRANVARPPRVAVIGAGLSGLVCAHTLADHGFPVTVFDKSRGIGGRLATRRVDEDSFDHGAQYFTARDPRFLRYVEAWADRGVVGTWTPEGREAAGGKDTWWVGVPGMSTIGRHLAQDLTVVPEATVRGVQRSSDGWRLVDEHGAGRGIFDMVVVATPAPQAVPLLGETPALAEAAAGAGMAPCWAALVAFEEPLAAAADVRRPDAGPLAWICRNAAKPSRGEAETWVLHGSPAWSRTNLERRPEEVLPDLLAAFADELGRVLPAARYARAHRWRYALADRPLDLPCLFDPEAGLGACGDWCLGGRVEAAFLSGAAVAGRLLNTAVDRARSG